MYSLTRLIPFKDLLTYQFPVLAISLIFAEIFYKFHSFTLECLAFLATWYVIDLTYQFAKRQLLKAHLKNQGKKRGVN